MLKVLKLIEDSIAYPLRWKIVPPFISPYLKNVRSVLDLGSSSGRLAFELSKTHKDTAFTGADVFVPNDTFIPVTKYASGGKLPFSSDSFDCVMIVDTLHHDSHPELILAEARRVCKKFILIKDHYWESKADLLALRCMDYVANKPYGINLPYNYLSIQGWKELIKSCGLKSFKMRKFRYGLADPLKEILLICKRF